MKKVIPCIFLLLFILCACSGKTLPYGENTETVIHTESSAAAASTTKPGVLLDCENNADGNSVGEGTGTTVPLSIPGSIHDIQGEIRGVWLSYYEIDVDSNTDTREKYSSYIDSLCQKFSLYRITDAFVHVRPYADAFYKSSVYPTSSYCGVNQGEEAPFDLLEVICEVMGRYNIRVHAWINPYRVSNSTDITELSENNKARQWYAEGSARDVAAVGGKLYFNPASEKAQQLVVDGAKEILQNYPVAGIHIDDYFYPPDCGSFDSSEYQTYLSSGGTLSLDDWRRDNVNKLVRNLYSAVKSFGAEKIFSISPAGNIENNYQSLYADVSLWCKGGYADMIIPQIYFGFEHESHPFDACVNEWYSLKAQNIKMPVGLALYKAGTEDSFAGTGKSEWQHNSNIITRQVHHLRGRSADGFVIFSTEFFLESSGAAKVELDGLRQYINQN